MPEIRAVDVDTKLNCIICGKETRHRHSNEKYEGIPVCLECCVKGCNGVHKKYSEPVETTICKGCGKRVETPGIMMDKLICPFCYDVLN